MCESVISVNPEEEPVQRPRRSRRVPVQRRQTSGGGRTESDMSGLNVLSVWLIYVCFLQVSTSLPHVERYDVIKPRRLQQRHRRSLKENQVFPDSVSYELEIEGRNHTIHLEKNSELIGKDFTEIFYTNDGKRVTTSPDEDHCFYHGRVEGVSDSVVSVGICSGLSGFVRARQQLYFIEPLGSSDDGEHAVYKPEHLKTNGSRRCGFNDTVTYDHEEDGDNMAPHAGLFRSRSWKTSSVSSPQRFVELFVVVDNTEYKRYGPETKSRILGVVNHVDKLYRPLNIRVVLVGLEIWSYRDYIDVDIDSETTLDHFLMWRQADLLQRSKHDNAQFVTGKDFDSDTVGLANKFAMCTENSGGVNQDHHHNPIGLASTIAHEMGHNFGLSHDDASCVCGPTFSSGNCVMADKLRTGSQAFPEFFSSCSLKQLDDFMERARPGCLDKPNPSRTIAVGPRCGNAMLDPGEECDCGGVEECKNPCCDAATCRLTEGSQCAHGLCCDNCQFRASGSVCRTSAGDCDLPEFCSGLTEDCPDDAFVMNGKPCFDRADGFCYNGRCPTHEQHCWRLFGPGSMVSPDICYDLNKRGEEGANCGKRGKFGFMPCAAQDFKCGSIFCGGGGESITGKRAAYTVFSLECKLAVDDDKTRRMDMVPKGAKCGTNKVCLDNKCVDVSVYGKKEDCAKKCNNKGVCNHKNECQCDPGWAPPDCSVQFSDLPPGQTGIITGVCAALSILLLITVVIAGLMCCKKDNVDNYTSKRKVHSAPGKLNPMFEDPVVKDRPQISQPTFMESTASQVNSPLMPLTPSRLPPQPPHHMTMTSPRHVSTTSSTSQSDMMKPQAPVKPLPPLNKPPFKPVKPPVPPVKPSPPPAARRQPGSPPAPAPPAAAAKPRLHR